MDRRSRRLVSRFVSKTQGGRCALQVEVTVTSRVWLNGFDATTYITKGAHFFLESPLIRTPQLSVLAVGKSYDG